MKAMILAAGLGIRMRPLTETTPKPLLRAGGRTLIEYHLMALQKAGIKDVIINYSRLGKQIEDYLTDGARYGLNICYSPEGENPLETGGGILRVLPFFNNAPFIVVNADIWTDYPYARLIDQLNPQDLAYLVLVDNPEHHPAGDFVIEAGRIYNSPAEMRLTFSGIGVYHPDLFAECQSGSFPLAPLLRTAINSKRVGGELWRGTWFDIGTPTRLQDLQRILQHEEE